VTGDAAADELLNTDGLALLIGMLLDQQVPMEWAFMGPASLRTRLGDLDAARIAAMDPDELVAVFCAKPALHRYPAVMARRTLDLCTCIVERYDGKAELLWEGVDTGAELYGRLRELPGYGQEKAQIFVAILAKRRGVRPAAGRPRPVRSPTPSPAPWPTSTPPSRSPACATGRRPRRPPERTSRTAP